MSTAELEAQRIKLEAFYAERGIPSSDAKKEIKRQLEKYSKPDSGGWDKMWASLRKKYDGAGSAAGIMPSAEISTKSTDVSKRPKCYRDADIDRHTSNLREFYTYYAPEKVPETEKNIKKYSRVPHGLEDMWASLGRKYSADVNDMIADAVQAADAFVQPQDTASSVKPSVVVGEGAAQGNAPPPPPGTELQGTSVGSVEDEQRARLYRFYSKYAPNKLGDVAKTIAKYTSDPSTGGYPRMWQQLVDRYGPEPENTNRMLALGLDDSRPGRNYTKEVRDIWRQRLRKFYAYYAPQKGPEEIEDALDRYGPPNGYEKMWQQLLAKYGAEPIDPPSGLVKRFLEEDDDDAAVRRELISGPEGASPPALVTASPRGGGGAGMDDDDEFRDPRAGRAFSEASGVSSRAERLPYSPLGFNAIAVVLHALLRLQGGTVMLYDKAVEERQQSFRKAVELEVALNLGIERRQVRVTDVKGGIAIELAIELTHEQVKHGVGEALVTKVLMGTFTVKHIRESYRRDLGGNPIQLHTEGAAIYGGACTPMFNEQPHTSSIGMPQVFATTRDATMAATRDATSAKEWARNAYDPALPPDESSVDPRRQPAGSPSRGVARGSSLRPPGVAGAAVDMMSPILSPRSEITIGSMGSPSPDQASPLRTWASLDSTQLRVSNQAMAGVDHDTRRSHTKLMNPHGLRAQPAPSAGHLPVTHSFLGKVWNDGEKSSSQFGSGGYVTTTQPLPVTADGQPIAPMSHGSLTERAWREMAKPTILNPNPSTDDVPLPTRTAPPTVTHFRPEAAIERHSDSAGKFKEAAVKRHIDEHHVTELLHAIRSPVEYGVSRTFANSSTVGGANQRTSASWTTESHLPPSHQFTSGVGPTITEAGRTVPDIERMRDGQPNLPPRRNLVLAPSFDTARPVARSETSPTRRRLQAEYGPDEQRRVGSATVPPTRPGYTPQYLMDIVEALEI